MNKRGTMRGEMATLPKWIRRPLWAITACVAGFIGLMVLAVALAPFTGDDESAPAASSDATPPAARTVLATATPHRTNTPGPTNTPTLTPTPRPTNTPVPPTPVPTPIAEAASGSGVISGLYLPSGIWMARWTHQGGGNFAVWAYPATGARDLLINEIGAYSGTVMLLGPETYDLDITAGGSWTMAISPVGVQSSPDSSDRGDAVTGLFPVSGSRMTVTATHSGSSNFAVWLHCDKGSALFKNEIGRVSQTSILSLPSGARTCLWEITADGDWSLIVQ